MCNFLYLDFKSYSKTKLSIYLLNKINPGSTELLQELKEKPDEVQEKGLRSLLKSISFFYNPK